MFSRNDGNSMGFNPMETNSALSKREGKSPKLNRLAFSSFDANPSLRMIPGAVMLNELDALKTS